jgi:hypothetical protein
VFRSSAIKAVREEEGKRGLAKPFALAVCDKDINYYLGGVEEISKLGLPNC